MLMMHTLDVCNLIYCRVFCQTSQMNVEGIDDIINQKGIKVMKVAQSVEICLNSKCIMKIIL